jgi:hypothetical protein
MSISSDRRRGDSKQLKRDQQVRREVLDEIGSEIVQDHAEPQYRNPNRDQSRGDWDRTGRRTDENSSRDDLARPGDDGLRPKTSR